MVLSYIDMNQPWIYMYSPSRSPLPPPTSLSTWSLWVFWCSLRTEKHSSQTCCRLASPRAYSCGSQQSLPFLLPDCGEVPLAGDGTCQYHHRTHLNKSNPCISPHVYFSFFLSFFFLLCGNEENCSLPRAEDFCQVSGRAGPHGPVDWMPLRIGWRGCES